MTTDQSARLILFSHEFPSGEVQDLLRRLHRYAKIPQYVQLARFLQESALVLRREIPKLPRPLRDLVPPFHDVMTLASRWDELKVTPLRSIWEGVFLCIYEIAMLIGLVSFGTPVHKHLLSSMTALFSDWQPAKETLGLTSSIGTMRHMISHTIPVEEVTWGRHVYQVLVSVSSQQLQQPRQNLLQIWSTMELKACELLSHFVFTWVAFRNSSRVRRHHRKQQQPQRLAGHMW